MADTSGMWDAESGFGMPCVGKWSDEQDHTNSKANKKLNLRHSPGNSSF
jgi:hypothetical protein